jgi:hypothetical protein
MSMLVPVRYSSCLFSKLWYVHTEYCEMEVLVLVLVSWVYLVIINRVLYAVHLRTLL